MEITLNVKSTNVKKIINFIVSICFIIFGTISCYIMTYFDTVINNAMDIIIKVISTLFFILFALAAVFMNIVFYGVNSDVGYYLASGFGIGTGIAVECCALLKYPPSALFFWPFALIPIIIFAINTTIWTFICKSNIRNDITCLPRNKKILSFILSFIMSIGICVALLIYIVIGGLHGEYYLFLPIIFIVPILLSTIVCYVISAIKKREHPLLSLIIGLVIGLSWILQFNKFLDTPIFNTNVSFTIFSLGFVGFTVLLAYKVIDCILIIKTNKNTVAPTDFSSNQ